jgi:alpha-tubulin suppressor-like RCC1 family protein
VNGRVEAWATSQNQVFNGTINVPEDALTGVIDVASGSEHNIALKRINATATQLIQWGRDVFGLGNVPARDDLVAVTASGFHVLALTASGSVVFWGDDGEDRGKVPQVSSGIVAIAVGGRHCMALMSNGSVLAWGGSHGQSNVPTEAQSGVTKIEAGGFLCLALRSDGRVIAWGQYQVFNGAQLEFQAVPRTPPGMESGVVDIAALSNLVVARKQNGSIVSFGQDSFGALNFTATL